MSQSMSSKLAPESATDQAAQSALTNASVKAAALVMTVASVIVVATEMAAAQVPTAAMEITAVMEVTASATQRLLSLYSTAALELNAYLSNVK